jgi:ribosomal RNA-processing protein 36
VWRDNLELTLNCAAKVNTNNTATMNRTQPAKRRFPFSGLQRRVRARKDEPEPEYNSQSSDQGRSDDEDNSEASDGDGGAVRRQLSDDNDEEASEDDDVDEEEDEDEEPASATLSAAQISFGALAKAQASMPSARRKHHKGGEDEDDDDDASGRDQDENDDDEDSEPEEFDRHGARIRNLKAPAGRSNKHAPAEMTSKRPVTRRRQVVEVHRPQARDPRFLPLPGGRAAAQREQQAEEALRRNYAFLDAYRDTEMAALKTSIKKAKDPRQKERLTRALTSMQGKKQARERRDAERAVIAEHRRRERELVKDGKNPFYLKKSEQKKQLLMDRFAGMKKSHVDKVIQRKRKAQAAKERMELPTERRAR